jgi:hypothetical protein
MQLMDAKPTKHSSLNFQYKTSQIKKEYKKYRVKINISPKISRKD